MRIPFTKTPVLFSKFLRPSYARQAANAVQKFAAKPAVQTAMRWAPPVALTVGGVVVISQTYLEMKAEQEALREAQANLAQAQTEVTTAREAVLDAKEEVESLRKAAQIEYDRSFEQLTRQQAITAERESLLQKQLEALEALQMQGAASSLEVVQKA